MEFGQDAEMEANDMKMKAKDVYVDADRVIHREIFHRKYIEKWDGSLGK